MAEKAEIAEKAKIDGDDIAAQLSAQLAATSLSDYDRVSAVYRFFQVECMRAGIARSKTLVPTVQEFLIARKHGLVQNDKLHGEDAKCPVTGERSEIKGPKCLEGRRPSVHYSFPEKKPRGASRDAYTEQVRAHFRGQRHIWSLTTEMRSGPAEVNDYELDAAFMEHVLGEYARLGRKAVNFSSNRCPRCAEYKRSLHMKRMSTRCVREKWTEVERAPGARLSEIEPWMRVFRRVSACPACGV